jgi:iron-sulfur cluster assembly protein
MITLTDKAASKIKDILKSEHKEGSALRLGIKGGGCSGYTYTLNIEDNKSTDDQIFEDKEVQIIVDPKSYIYLNGTELDYKDSLTDSGFTFNNPNVTRSCGCGSSFQT